MKHSKRGNGPDACVLQRPAPGSGSIRPQGDGRLRSCGRIHRTWTSHGASGGRVMGRVAGAQESSSTTTYWPRRNCSWKRTPGAPFGSDHSFAPSDVWVADWGPTLQPAPHGGHQYLGGRGRPSRCPGPPGGHKHISTTRKHYVPVLNSRMQEASELINGRFSWTRVVETQGVEHVSRKQK